MSDDRDIRIEEGPARHLVGLRRSVKMAEAPSVCPQMWAEFVCKVPLPHQTEPVMYGVNDAMDVANGQWDYMVAVEVSQPDESDGHDHLVLKPATYAVLTHEGPASALGQSYEWFYQTWLPTSSRELSSAPSYERYGPGYDPETMSGDTELWFSLKG